MGNSKTVLIDRPDLLYCSFILMNLKELKEIIDIVTSKESIEELELEKSGVRLRIKRASNNHVATSVSGVAAAAVAPALAPTAVQPAAQEPAPKNEEDKDLY